MDILVAIKVHEPAAQIGKRRFRGPDVVDNEMAIAEPPMMGYEQGDYCMQVILSIDWWRISSNEMVAVKHHAMLNTFGECFGERRFADPEWAIEQNDHEQSLCKASVASFFASFFG